MFFIHFYFKTIKIWPKDFCIIIEFIVYLMHSKTALNSLGYYVQTLI